METFFKQRNKYHNDNKTVEEKSYYNRHYITKNKKDITLKEKCN